MKYSDLKIVKNKLYPIVGRCVYCDAQDFCGVNLHCNCNIDEHYKDIKKERKLKLQKIYERK